jgi:hypothetical protein
MDKDKFNIDVVLAAVEKADAYFKEKGDVDMENIWVMLFEFTKLFRVIGGIMSTAESDVTSKVDIMRTNLKKCPLDPKPIGFKAFVEWEISQKLHELNGDDGAKSDKRYCSTARTLLRQMWFMTYLLTIFQGLADDVSGKIPRSASELFKLAYTEAFGENHGFMLRQAAKVAIMATANKEAFIDTCLEGKSKDHKDIIAIGEKYCRCLNPSYKFLWKFYE